MSSEMIVGSKTFNFIVDGFKGLESKIEKCAIKDELSRFKEEVRTSTDTWKKKEVEMSKARSREPASTLNWAYTIFKTFAQCLMIFSCLFSGGSFLSHAFPYISSLQC